MMTPADRQAMRDTLARALKTADTPDAAPVHPGRFSPPSSIPVSERLQRFTAELQALGGIVHHISTAEGVAALVAELVTREGASSVLSWDEQWLPLPGVHAALEAAGIRVIRQHAADAQDGAARQAWAAAGVGLTAAVACLAQTGSIVVVSGPGRGRLASLLPPIHVALVSQTMLWESLPELLTAQPELATGGTNLVCITGPSRTADIEHTLSRGVHGPRDIHVVIV